MRQRPAAMIAVTTLTLALAACGDDAGSQETENQDPPSDTEASGEIVAVSSETDLGNILVGADGMTLYAFTNDADGQSECTGTCAEAWPPLIVGEGWDVGPELDSAIFNTHTREDGTKQLVIGQWPLYYYAQDTVPGDMKGQGSGGVWFVVSAEDGSLIQEDAPDSGDAEGADVQVGETDLGEVLTDAEGFTLYGFTNDADGQPTCTGECAGTWPALLVEDEPSLGEGLDAETFTTVDGVEGGTQVVAGKWPLYRFAGDGGPGDVNGQGSGDVWFAVAPDGSLIGADGAAPASDGGDGGSSGDY